MISGYVGDEYQARAERRYDALSLFITMIQIHRRIWFHPVQVYEDPRPTPSLWKWVISGADIRSFACVC